MFRFASPWFLILILPVLGILVYRKFTAQKAVVRTAGLYGLSHLSPGIGVRLSTLMPFLKAAALCLMILALARPQAGEQKSNVMTEGVNVILALDLSESMNALDFKLKGNIVNRLEAVKSVVSDFIMKRDGDRIGLVVFGSNAFTQLPLTRDYNTISFMLDRLEIGAAGPKTAIGDALGIALKRIADIPSKSNIIILLTDGESNAGELSWQDAADIAAQKKVKVYTIGVGSEGEAPFLVDGLFGKRYVYHKVNVDLEALKEIAQKTGASFFKAEDTQSLENIYTMIDSLEKTKVEVEKWVEYKELYPGVLLAGLLLFLAHMGLSRTWLMRIP